MAFVLGCGGDEEGDGGTGGTAGAGGTGVNNPPVIDYVAWEHGPDCTGIGATTIEVTVSAQDPDDPTGETLTYEGAMMCCDSFSVTSTPSPVTATSDCDLATGTEPPRGR